MLKKLEKGEELSVAERASIALEIERQKRKEKEEKEAREFISPDLCFQYSTKLNRQDKTITDQGCRLTKPLPADSLEKCRKQCVEHGDSCKSFVYRSDGYKGNNCWLKDCDGSRRTHTVDIGNYGLQA